MSVNFLNNSAVMAGIDDHEFLAPGPPPLFHILFPHFPYIVGAPFFWPAIFWNRTGTVTADTWKMIDVDFSLLLVPHVAPAAGGPLQPYKYLEIIGTSGSEASFGIGSVTGEGDPLAACLVACAGLNLNCWTVGDQPSGGVICVSSVKTTPSLLDYALGAFKWFVVGFLGEYLGGRWGKGLGKVITKISQAVWEFIVKQAVINAMEQVAALIRYLARRLGY